MFRRLLLMLVVACVVLVAPAAAQPIPDPRIPITPENAGQLTPLTLLSRGYIRDILWSPDGARIALVTGMGVWLYDAADLSAEAQLLPSDAYVTSAVFSEDSAYLAVGYNNSVKVEIWDIAAGAIARTIHRENPRDYSQTVTMADMSFSVDRTDEVVHASIIIDNRQVVFSSASASSQGSTFSASGDMIVGATLNSVGGGTLYVVDAALNEVVRERPLEELPCNFYFIPRVALSPDEARIAIGCPFVEAIYLLDTAILELVQTLRADGAPLGDFMFSADGRMLVASGESEIFLWDTASGDLLMQLPGFGRAAFSPDGQSLVAQQNIDGETVLHIWDLQDRQPIQTLPLDDYRLYRYAAFTAESDQIISVTDDAVHYWGLEGNPIDRLRLSFDWVEQQRFVSIVTAAYSHDRRLVSLIYTDVSDIYGTPPSQIVIVDLSTGTQQIVTEEHYAGWLCNDVSPSGNYMIYDDDQPIVWDVENSTELLRLPSMLLCKFRFAPDDLLILAASDGLDFIDVETGKVVTHLANVIWGEFSFVTADNETFGTLNRGYGGNTSTINLWDIETDSLRLTIPLHPDEDVTALTISPDSTLLAAGGESGTLWLWDAATGDLLFTARQHVAAIWQIFFSPDGTLLFTSNTGGLFDGSGPIDGATYLWGIPAP